MFETTVYNDAARFEQYAYCVFAEVLVTTINSSGVARALAASHNAQRARYAVR
jgi:hypothetical protein